MRWRVQRDNQAMERGRLRPTKKLKAKKGAAIRKMRGKYKHLDLMSALLESRAEDRQSPAHLTAAVAHRGPKFIRSHTSSRCETLQ